MTINEANKKDIDLLAQIVRESNNEVAEMFNLNIHTAPKHPSFCKSEWILAEFDRGQRYFTYCDEGIVRGCVAYEQPNENISYLNRLSVLPEHRNKGIGSKLVNFILEFSKYQGVGEVSIGVIAEHTKLIKWYQKFGFSKGATQKFEHLPFNVLYMQYKLQKT
jgi:ribosomal protein S18 acetylase RimI-like enzyme